MSHAPRGGLGSAAFAGKNTRRVVDVLFNPRISYVGIKEETQQKLQLLNHGFRLRKLDAELPEELRSFTHINDAFSKFYSGDDGSGTFFLASIAEQSPNRNSRVSLSRTKDFTGMKKLRLDFRTNDIDRRSVAASFDFLAAELGRLGLGGCGSILMTRSACRSSLTTTTWEQPGCITIPSWALSMKTVGFTALITCSLPAAPCFLPAVLRIQR